MRRYLYLIVLACTVACSMRVIAYMQYTHGVISQYAVENSAVNDNTTGLLQTLDLGSSVNDPSAGLPASAMPPDTCLFYAPPLMQPSIFDDPFFLFNIRITPEMLVCMGAVNEDNGTQSLYHFYDPQQNEGLTVLNLHTFTASPDWILEDTTQYAAQSYSYREAKQYLYLGLTSAAKADRLKNVGLLFESLGHIIHHIQDMHQPQHVRNDMHCDDSPITVNFLSINWGTIPQGCKDFPLPQGVLYNPSGYEAFWGGRDPYPELAGYPAPDYGTFSSPRSFWINGGQGAPEFTSNNFVSAGTNYVLKSVNPVTIGSDSNHLSPSGAAASLVDRSISSADLLGATSRAAGTLSLVQAPVTDSYNPTFSTLNTKASTLSLFYNDLVVEGQTFSVPKAGFTLNGINYETAGDLLLPHAAGYSIGLINYLFRGRIEVTLPDDGIYSVVDHATMNAAGVIPSNNGGQGFTTLKVKLRNATSSTNPVTGAAVSQSMTSGSLIAIARYTLNSCYTPNLLGDFGISLDGNNTVTPPQNCTNAQYVTGEEQVSISTPLTSQSLDPTTPTAVAFDFSLQPIPVNAHDLTIQVVYQGTLGSETDGLATGFKDISEPTYLVLFNDSDYFDLNGTLYTPAQISADPNLSQQVQGIDINPAPIINLSLDVNSFFAGPTSIQPDGYVRVAVLADPGTPFALTVLYQFQGFGGFSVNQFPGVNPAVVQLYSNPPILQGLGIFRGIRGDFIGIIFKTNQGAPLPDNGQIQTLSTQMVTDNGPTVIPITFQ